MDAIWIVLGCVFWVGVVAGMFIATLVADSHSRSAVARAYELGEEAGRRQSAALIPFPTDDRPKAA